MTIFVYARIDIPIHVGGEWQTILAGGMAAFDAQACKLQYVVRTLSFTQCSLRWDHGSVVE